MNGTQVGYNYFSGATYAANGAPLGWTLGNGLTETESYNNRWQPANHVVANSSATLLSRTYSFYDQSTPARDDGNVMKITDNSNAGRSLSFTYDALSRVTGATTAATSGADCWGQSYGYDNWGNLTAETPTQCSAPQLSVTATANNQVSATGVTYDAAGDTTDDGTHGYTFDAEGNLTQVDGGGTAASAFLVRAEEQNVSRGARASCGGR